MATFLQILGIVVTIFASSGFWQYMIYKAQQKDKIESTESKLLMGIAYGKICDLCARHIKNGYIGRTEYAELKKYLYDPYRAMGGNGTCEKLMREIEKLPLKED